MSTIHKGDIVARKSYNADMMFKVIETLEGEEDGISYSIAMLKGIESRLIASAPFSDLIKLDQEEVERRRENMINESKSRLRHIYRQRITRNTSVGWRGPNQQPYTFQEFPGTVLHLDGDPDYMQECVNYYNQMKIPVIAQFVEEKEQPRVVRRLLEEYHPDILILTGHDGLIVSKKNKHEVGSYYHTKYFVEAVKEARRYDINKDSLVIFAGACQSHYERILEAGANFASAPERVFIHCFDPVLIAEKVAYTPINEIVKIDDLIINTITGIKGVGGIETRGKFRLGLPRLNTRG